MALPCKLWNYFPSHKWRYGSCCNTQRHDAPSFEFVLFGLGECLLHSYGNSHSGRSMFAIQRISKDCHAPSSLPVWSFLTIARVGKQGLDWKVWHITLLAALGQLLQMWYINLCRQTFDTCIVTTFHFGWCLFVIQPMLEEARKSAVSVPEHIWQFNTFYARRSNGVVANWILSRKLTGHVGF